MIKEFIRKLINFKSKDVKKLEEKEKKNAIVDFQCIYQDNNIENIFRGVFNGSSREVNYDNQVEFIKENLQDNKYLRYGIEKLSSIINLYTISANIDIDKLLEICLLFNGKKIIKVYKENYYLLLSGSITDYKILIKNSNINNEITQSVIESLYQTNSLYFEDMFKIMDKSLFVDDDNIELKYKSLVLDYGTLYEVTPVKHIYEKINKYGFTMNDVLNCSSILYQDDNSDKGINLYKIFFYDLYNTINPFDNDDYGYIKEELSKKYPKYIKEFLKPVYESVEEDQESYDEIDEAIGDIEEETFEVKKELIYEDEDGELHYDEANFL